MAVANSITDTVPTSRHSGIFVHALHKSATMFLYKFFKRIASERGLDFFSANDDPPREYGGQAVDSNICCCPVRTFEISDQISNVQPQRIFHVRDPRDMLVSEYFSFGWRHSTENSKLDQRRLDIQQMTIDQYVLQQPEFSSWPLEKKFEPLLNRIEASQSLADNDIIVKYETMVTEFPRWVADVIKPFEFWMPRIAVGRLAWRYRNEFRPSNDPGAHKRRITPGDFREQLQPETISKLNERFADVLSAFGYDA